MEQKIQTIIWASLLSLGICSVAGAQEQAVFNAEYLKLDSSITDNWNSNTADSLNYQREDKNY